MIAYFSGTGNSKYVAKRIAQKTEKSLLSINARLKNNETSVIDCKGDSIVFVCPTYGWRIPRVVECFIEKTKFIDCENAYFVLTCGDKTHSAVKYVEKLCNKKKFNLLGFAQVVMPENYIAMFDVPDKADAIEIIKKANPEIEKISQAIKEKQHLDKFNATGKLYSSVVNSIFYKLIVSDKGFYATDKCISCGDCVKACMLSNIELKDGTPRWNGNCTHCMACISNCPVEAIEYKGKTKGKTRYILNDDIKANV